MNWMGLALELAREAMRTGTTPEPQRQSEPSDLGTALTQQFALIDRNMDAFVKTLNAHNAKLEQIIRRQRVWNIALAAALMITLIFVLLRG